MSLFLVDEVVIDRSDDGRNDQDLDERPHREGEETDDPEDDPKGDANENDDADGLKQWHGRPFLGSHRRRRWISAHRQ